MTETTETTAVVVTTEHRGVFFGFITGDADRTARTIELKDAQMCVYWSQDVQGIVGLAATGPSSRCKITRPAPSITLQGVTAVIGATAGAVKLWQDRPWS